MRSISQTHSLMCIINLPCEGCAYPLAKLRIHYPNIAHTSDYLLATVKWSRQVETKYKTAYTCVDTLCVTGDTLSIGSTNSFISMEVMSNVTNAMHLCEALSMILRDSRIALRKQRMRDFCIYQPFRENRQYPTFACLLVVLVQKIVITNCFCA